MASSTLGGCATLSSQQPSRVPAGPGNPDTHPSVLGFLSGPHLTREDLEAQGGEQTTQAHDQLADGIWPEPKTPDISPEMEFGE